MGWDSNRSVAGNYMDMNLNVKLESQDSGNFVRCAVFICQKLYLNIKQYEVNVCNDTQYMNIVYYSQCFYQPKVLYL